MSGQPEVTSRDRRELSESLVKYRGFPVFLWAVLPGGLLSDFHAYGRPDPRGVLSVSSVVAAASVDILWPQGSGFNFSFIGYLLILAIIQVAFLALHLLPV